MKLIGLTGVAGAGKSTVAQYLVEQHGFTRLSFAAPLKKMLRTLNPVMLTQYCEEYTLNDVFNTHGNETAVKASPAGPEYRRLLQVLGTDCIRAVDEDFWVRAALAQMTDPDGSYVFDDVRFPNEARVIEERSPMGLWHIERLGHSAVNGHSSEAHAGNMGERIWLLNGRRREYMFEQTDEALDHVFEGSA